MAEAESSAQRLLRMRDLGASGEAIPPQDARHLASWVDRAVANNTSIDEGAQLGTGWQGWMRQRIARLSNWVTGNSQRAASRALRLELQRYIASGRFDRHLASTSKPIIGRDAELYAIALRYWRRDGRNRPVLASEETIRKDLAALQRG